MKLTGTNLTVKITTRMLNPMPTPMPTVIPTPKPTQMLIPPPPLTRMQPLRPVITCLTPPLILNRFLLDVCLPKVDIIIFSDGRNEN